MFIAARLGFQFFSNLSKMPFFLTFHTFYQFFSDFQTFLTNITFWRLTLQDLLVGGGGVKMIEQEEWKFWPSRIERREGRGDNDLMSYILQTFSSR